MIQQQKNKSPIFEQIKFFYEKIFIEFLLRNEMNIPNYLGLNYNDLTDEELYDALRIAQIEEYVKTVM